MIVNRTTVYMRSQPSGEIISQALFGESVISIEENGEWINIQTPDSYQGWVEKSALQACAASYRTNSKIRRAAAHLYPSRTVKQEPLLTLPYGVRIKVIEKDDHCWLKVELPSGTICFIQSGNIEDPLPPSEVKDLPLFSQLFLSIPYTWAGRSSFGFDCSGFVQMLYGEIGITLPRDSYQQAVDRQFETVEEPLPGDLLFFGEKKETITHVALYLGHHNFIHATSSENMPWIRVSTLSEDYWKERFCYARRLISNKVAF